MSLLLVLPVRARAQEAARDPKEAGVDTNPLPHYNDGFVLIPTTDPVQQPFRLKLKHVSQFKYTNTLAVARAMALTGIDVIIEPELLASVKEEFVRAKALRGA